MTENKSVELLVNDPSVFRARGSIITFACALEALKKAALRRHQSDLFRAHESYGGASQARALCRDFANVQKALDVIKDYLHV